MLGWPGQSYMRAYKEWKPIVDRQILIPKLLDTWIHGQWILGLHVAYNHFAGAGWGKLGQAGVARASLHAGL